MNNKGQAILSEYVMIFFVVIAALVAMTTFVQRGFEARIHDARNFMINSVTNSGVCDANCLQATGGNIGYGYEPYYSIMAANVQKNQQDTTGATQVLGAVYIGSSNEATQTNSNSCQLPPCCSANPVPALCSCVCS